MILSGLEAAGIFARTPRYWHKVRDFADEHERHMILGAFAQRCREDRSRLQTTLHYAQMAGCRTLYLQRYFGEPVSNTACGHCDVCLRTAMATSPQARTNHIPAGFSPGDKVSHPIFGAGIVMRLQGPNVWVEFHGGHKQVRAEYLPAQPRAALYLPNA